MSTVHSAVVLFGLIILAQMVLFGEGWLLAGPLISRALAIGDGKTSLLHAIPLILVSGLIVNYGVFLLLQSMLVSLIFGSILALAGICRFVFFLSRHPSWRTGNSGTISRLAVTCLVCLIILVPMVTTPLLEWDARSIWFFHAKMIYAARSIGQSAGWHDWAVAFSYSYYPVLVPALAAQLSYVMGLWNEFLPKLSLFFLLVPPIIWLFTFARKSWSFLLLLLLVPYAYSSLLWNGYMDGYFALYFLTSMLLLGRYAGSGQRIDLISSLCCLVLLLYIKNEGVLALIAGLCATLLVVLWQGRLHSIKKLFPLEFTYAMSALVAIAPFWLWELYKREWRLRNPYLLGAQQSLLHIYSRLLDGSLGSILRSVYGQTAPALLPLAVLLFAALVWRVPLPHRQYVPVLVASMVYCLGMIAVYLLTPYALDWQLQYSIQRTLLPVNAGILAASYFILAGIEEYQTSAHERGKIAPVPVEG